MATVNQFTPPHHLPGTLFPVITRVIFSSFTFFFYCRVMLDLRDPVARVADLVLTVEMGIPVLPDSLVHLVPL